MGGVGPGRWYRWNARGTVEGHRNLDVNRWHREGRLQAGQWFSCVWSRNGEPVAAITVWTEPESVMLAYRVRSGGSDWQDVQERVRLAWTPCRYGGRRPWFICPGVVNGRTCGRRVAKLYGAGRYFLCRQCYGLGYESQREDRWDRALSRSQKIRRQLGGEPGLIHPFPAKPKGMHWRTYLRLHEEAEVGEQAFNEKARMLLAKVTRLSQGEPPSRARGLDVRRGRGGGDHECLTVATPRQRSREEVHDGTEAEATRAD